MVDQAERLACAKLVARTPIGMSEHFVGELMGLDLSLTLEQKHYWSERSVCAALEGDSADTCARELPLMSMGGRAEGLACADPGVRTPIGVSGNFIVFFFTFSHFSTMFVSLYYLCFSNFGL